MESTMGFAEKFSHFVNVLNQIKDTYRITISRHANRSLQPIVPDDLEISHLELHLRFWLPSTVDFETRTGQVHSCVPCAPSARDGRKSFPIQINKYIIDTVPQLPFPWSLHQRFEMKWVACYLAGVVPDETIDGWQQFECSHRCIQYGLNSPVNGQRDRDQVGYHCIDPLCLLWESRSVNQSRGNDYCCRPCKHEDCNLTICQCQGIHNQPCM